MAQAKTQRGVELFVEIGNGADPEVFAHPCSINSERGIDFAADTNDTNVPDCDDPTAPQWTLREITRKGATVSGQGTAHLPDQDIFFDWFNSGEAKNVKVRDAATGANGGRTYTVAMLCTAFRKSGSDSEFVNFSITLVSNGAVAKSNNA